jgi:hypothetical protein
VPFHPWTTLDAYCDLLDTLEHLELVEHVAPIQLAIRLLIPEGSRMLEVQDPSLVVGPFDRRTLAYPWTHVDGRVDDLCREVTTIVGGRLTADRRAVFDEIGELAHDRAGLPRRGRPHARTWPAVPYLNEPWYCCAEPNPDQLRLV